MNDEHIPVGEAGHQKPAWSDGRRRFDSTDLLADQHEVIITHGADEYRLRLTRQGKLILTK